MVTITLHSSIKFHVKDNPQIIQRLSDESSRKQNRYIHNDFQNELLNIMANHVLRSTLESISKSTFFAIMADEYSDIFNKGQLTFCIRWIDD